MLTSENGITCLSVSFMF